MQIDDTKKIINCSNDTKKIINYSNDNLRKKYTSSYHDNYRQIEKVGVHRIIIYSPFAKRSIISYGLIVYAQKSKKFIIIQRKHSVEFLLFVRGFYRISYITFLLSNITNEEYKIITDCVNGVVPFATLYFNQLKLDKRGYEYALTRFSEIRSIFISNLSKITTHNVLTWTFPKGRLEYSHGLSTEKETPFECALREFNEEVEIILPPAIYISSNYLTEQINTITGRNIESRFWIYIIDDEIVLPAFNDHPEISDRKWVDFESCKQLINNDKLLAEVYTIINN